MSDAVPRELERRWSETRDPEDEARLIAERFRQGAIPLPRLALAQTLGHDGARSLPRQTEPPDTGSFIRSAMLVVHTLNLRYMPGDAPGGARESARLWLRPVSTYRPKYWSDTFVLRTGLQGGDGGAFKALAQGAGEGIEAWDQIMTAAKNAVLWHGGRDAWSWFIRTQAALTESHLVPWLLGHGLLRLPLRVPPEGL